MDLMHQNSNSDFSSGLNGGLNGWLGRRLKSLMVVGVNTLAKVLDARTYGMFSGEIEKVKGKVLSGIENLGSEGGFFGRGGSTGFEVTMEEERIIETWFNTRFLPFYTEIGLQIGLAIENLTGNEQLKAIDVQLMKMCIVRDYFEDNEKRGLSDNAVEQRSELINQLFEVLEKSVYESIGLPIPRTVIANQAFFTSIFYNTVSGQSYACRGLASYTTTSTQPQVFPGSSNPPKNSSPVSSNPAIKVDPFGSADVAMELPIAAEPSESAIMPKLHWLTWILGGIAVYGFVDRITSKKKVNN